jgi:hypothetical protein
MKRSIYATLAAGAAMFAAPSAHAVQLAAGSSIDLAGFVRALGGTTLGSATSLDFIAASGAEASPGVAGVVTAYGSGTGSLAGFMCMTGTCGTIQDITNLTVGAQNITNFFTLTGGNNANPIFFDLTSISSIGRADEFLTFTALGNIRFAGFDPTPGRFLFSAQGGTTTSFSATALANPVQTAVPEPAVWAMMLFGFGGLGYSMRRRPKQTMRVRFAA